MKFSVDIWKDEFGHTNQYNQNVLVGSSQIWFGDWSWDRAWFFPIQEGTRFDFAGYRFNSIPFSSNLIRPTQNQNLFQDRWYSIRLKSAESYNKQVDWSLKLKSVFCFLSKIFKNQAKAMLSVHGKRIRHQFRSNQMRYDLTETIYNSISFKLLQFDHARIYSNSTVFNFPQFDVVWIYFKNNRILLSKIRLFGLYFVRSTSQILVRAWTHNHEITIQLEFHGELESIQFNC